VARTPTQARAAAVKFLADPANATGKVVIKAQVLVGGRGKAGGVKLAGSADEAEDVAADILALEIKGLPVRRVLVAPAADIVKEYYLSVLLDRGTKRLMFIGTDNYKAGVMGGKVAASRLQGKGSVVIYTMPEQGNWNFKGYLYNGWHHVAVEAV